MSKDPIRMIDVSGKETVARRAVAAGVIKLKASTVDAIREGEIKKGAPLTVGEIAAILAVKNTPDLIPLCHNIPIGKAHVEYTLDETMIEARCTVTTYARTGVEMEALAGVTVALLNIWDMTKYLEKDGDGQYPDTVITDIRVIEKVKGK